MTPRDPINVYGRTKSAAEDVVHALAATGFPAHVLRMTNLYGTYEVAGNRVSKPTVINHFVDRAVRGESLEVYAPGTQERDYLHVEDAAEAFRGSVHGLLEANRSDETETGVIPVASGETLSVLEIAELAVDIADSNSEIRAVPNPRADDEPTIETMNVSTTEAAHELAFEPQHDVEGTIEEMIEYV